MTVRNLVATEGLSQIHTYGGRLSNDKDHWDNLIFEPMAKFSHGHHARAGGGNDTYNFCNVDNVSGVVVGRLEDFDPTRDEIRIDGILLDFNNLPTFVRIVEFNGGHNDPGAQPQRWILIDTPAGGQVFYALEGARIDMDGNGGSNGGNHENHFIFEYMLPDLGTLRDLSYENPCNIVPDGFVPDGGVVINDVDRGVDDVLQVINGTDEGDLIAAGLNDDTVLGGGGNDMIWGGGGHDLIDGGKGADVIEGNDGNDDLLGRGGDDIIVGGKGRDTLNGGNGNDKLEGGSGADVLRGANGYDLLTGGSGNDKLFGGNGRDTVLGGAGNDMLLDNDQRGAHGADKFLGEGGKDVIRAGGGNDTLVGGNGNDRLYGGLDNDLLVGGRNYDKLFGQAGDDNLAGGGGRDTMVGGHGNDILRDNYQSGIHDGDLMVGGTGDDTLRIGGGDDTMSGGAGSDTFEFFGAAIESDSITDYEIGIDALQFDDALWQSDLTAEEVVSTFATADGNNVVFDFGGGNSVTLLGIGSLAGLVADMEII